MTTPASVLLSCGCGQSAWEPGSATVPRPSRPTSTLTATSSRVRRAGVARSDARQHDASRYSSMRRRSRCPRTRLRRHRSLLAGRGLSVYPWSAGDKAEVESHASRFRVMSYNILGGDLAQEHRYLYKRVAVPAAHAYARAVRAPVTASHFALPSRSSVPHALLDWNRRWGSIAREIRHLRPDVVCCQEVEAFEEAFRDMAAMGYQARAPAITAWRIALVVCVTERWGSVGTRVRHWHRPCCRGATCAGVSRGGMAAPRFGARAASPPWSAAPSSMS